MTPATMQALRRLLFFSRPEAALLVAASAERPDGVSDRAWRQWEDGERNIPADVARNLSALAAWRETALAGAMAAIRKQEAERGAAERVDLIWYETIDDWISLPGREPELFRPQQSVCAALAAAIPAVRLVPFDGPAYATWLCGRGDSELMRSQWAGSAADKNND